MTAVEPVAGPRFQVAVVGLGPELEARIERRLGHRADVESVHAVGELKVGAGRAPTVVVLGPEFAEAGALDAAVALVNVQPAMAAVLVAKELSTTLLQQAMRAGVSDVVTYDSDPSDLEQAIDRAAAHLSARVTTAPPVVTADAEPRGRVLTVFSPKGGSGKSVIACNLAVLLAQRSSEPVVLIDADLQFGDVAVMLKLAPQHTIVDAVSAMHRLDAPLLRSLLSTHGQTGLLVLPAPREPAFGDQVTPADMHTILELLRGICAYVIVDTPTQFSDVALHLIEESDHLVLVAGMDVPSIKNMKIGLQTLKLLGTPSSKLRLVLNRANAKVGLDVAEVEKTLHLKAEALIPSDILVPQSVNKGVPAVVSTPKSSFAKSLTAFADVLAPETPRRHRRG